MSLLFSEEKSWDEPYLAMENDLMYGKLISFLLLGEEELDVPNPTMVTLVCP